jgi:AraC-like DNA-binding protein
VCGVITINKGNIIYKPETLKTITFAFRGISGMFQFLISGGGMMFLFFAIASLINRQGNLLLNRLFGLALLSRFCQILTYFSTLNGDIQTLYYVYPLNGLMQLLSPALFFLYLQSFIRDRNKLSPLQYLHFLPVFLLLWETVSWFFIPQSQTFLVLQGIVEQRQFFSTNPFSLLPEALQHPLRRGITIVYLFAVWIMVVKGTRGQIWNMQRRWIYFLASAMTINQLLLLVQYIVLVRSGGISQELFLAPAQILLMMVLFGVLFYDPRLLYGQLLVSEKWRKPVHLKDLIKEEATPEKMEDNTRKAPVDEEKIQHYIETMKELMEVKKPFLNPEYQISGLSSDLGMPVHHCSYVLNYHMGKGFRDWVNGYRVKHFLQQLPLKSGTKTIEAIAMESGFKNVTTFYNAFKKEKGQLPGEYIKKRL